MSYPSALVAKLNVFNDYQITAAMSGGGLLLLAGVPGSGKTLTISARIARLIADGLPPQHILAMTFTNAGVASLKSKIASLGVSPAAIEVCTIHSLCRKILAKETHALNGLALDGHRLGWERKKALRALRRARVYPAYGSGVDDISRFISDVKARGPIPVEKNLFRLNSYGTNHVRSLCGRWATKLKVGPKHAFSVYMGFEEHRATLGLYDFDDMLNWAWMVLVADEAVRRRWRMKYSIVIIDELQDNCPVQWDIAYLLAGLETSIPEVKDLAPLPDDLQTGHNLMAAGDPAQCHPPYVKVLTKSGDIEIGSLRNRDGVKGWGRSAQKMLGSRGVVIKKRYYTGDLLTINVSVERPGRRERRSTDVTPNHRFLCRWADSAVSRCVTYLMFRSDRGFRVGWCQLLRKASSGAGKGGLHLAVRARIEKAKAVWILRDHDSRKDASVYESIIAAKYGIPTATFEPVRGAAYLTEDAIVHIFSAVAGDNKRRGLQCLKDHFLDFELPFWPQVGEESNYIGSGGSWRRRTYFKVFAANMLPSLMRIPIPDGVNAWALLTSISRRQYNGYVFSLDVERDHAYAADGIITLNSIYSFRAASPKKLLEFSERPDARFLPLPLNYRSVPEICRVASKLIDDKDWNLSGKIVSTRGAICSDESPIQIKEFPSQAEELEWIVQQARDLGLGNCAVLSRLNATLDLIEVECVKSRVRYLKRSKGSFFTSKIVQDLTAYLRVACWVDPEGRWAKHVLNNPFRFFSSKELRDSQILGAQSKGNALYGLQMILDSLSFQKRQTAGDLLLLMHKLNRMAVASEGAKGSDGYDPETGPYAMMRETLDATKYIEEVRKQEGLLALDESRVGMINELLRIALSFQSPIEFLAYLDHMAIAIKKAKDIGLRAQEGDTEGALVLSTVHASKGLEWPNVFIAACNQGMFPCEWAEDYQEELRLFYVALTRAADQCYVTHAAPAVNEDGEPVYSSLVQELKQVMEKDNGESNGRRQGSKSKGAGSTEHAPLPGSAESPRRSEATEATGHTREAVGSREAPKCT